MILFDTGKEFDNQVLFWCTQQIYTNLFTMFRIHTSLLLYYHCFETVQKYQNVSLLIQLWTQAIICMSTEILLFLAGTRKSKI